MKKVIKASCVLASLLCLSGTVMATAPELVQSETCKRTTQGEEILRSSEFSWGMSLEEIKKKEVSVYERGFRLKERAFLENGQVYLPYTPYGGSEEKIKLSDRFIKSVIAHVEEGLKRGYIDAVIFPDMGHSHLFIPQKFYDEKIKPIPAREGHKRYELMLNHEETRFLYHTAEQLTMIDEDKKLIDDRKIQWRFFTRNLVGGNKALGKIELLHNETHSHNTARSYEEGYRYWGAGFNINGSKNGCFAYKRDGKTFYFDLSLKDLEP
ncbi:MAG: hypothetical protein VXV96_03755 [Bdellovibrionota bacterium]|nr:hypothetical protein [Bdellovibrionota bacterium]